MKSIFPKSVLLREVFGKVVLAHKAFFPKADS